MHEEGWDRRARRHNITLDKLWPLLQARGGVPCESEAQEVEDSEEDDYWGSEDEDLEGVMGEDDETEQETVLV
jgi:hypothetical protein